MRNCRIHILMMAVMVCLVPPGHASQVSYPLLGHFSNREGTIEFWLTPQVSLYPENTRVYAKVFDLFRIEGVDDFNVGGSWYRHGARQLGFKVSISSQVLRDGLLPILPGDGIPEDLRPGEPMHIALVWRERSMSVWLNGERIGVRGQMTTFSGLHGGGRLVVGAQGGETSPIILHALRVSSRALPPNGGIPEPTADAATLLLDVFDKPLDRETALTQPRVIAGFLREAGGSIQGRRWHWVAAPRPGIAFFPEPENKEPSEK